MEVAEYNGMVIITNGVRTIILTYDEAEETRKKLTQLKYGCKEPQPLEGQPDFE